MQTTIKNRSKVPNGTRQSCITLAPQTGDFMGSVIARVTGTISIDEPLERVVAASISLTPDEAREVAARLIATADAADAMLAAQTDNGEETMIRLIGWVPAPDADHCCLLCREGGDPSKVADRVAFIEKSPRVRIAPFTNANDDWKNWCYGPKGDHGFEGADDGMEYDRDSQIWCEDQLRGRYDMSLVRPGRA